MIALYCHRGKDQGFGLFETPGDTQTLTFDGRVFGLCRGEATREEGERFAVLKKPVK